MMAKLALEADVCYNERINIVVPEDAANTFRTVANLLWRFTTMDSLYPHADNGNTSLKPCSKCKRVLPVEAFHRNNKRKNGLQSQCKECKSTKKPPNAPEGHRRCTVCKSIYPATTEFFSRQASVKCGLRSHCKVCTAKEHIEYTSDPEVKEHLRVYGQEYQSRPEVRQHRRDQSKIYVRLPEIRERNRANRWKWRGSPEAHERDRVYAEERRNTPEYQEWYQAYSALPHTKLLRRGHSHKHRSRKKAVLGTYTAAQIQEQLKRQHYRCYYAACGFSKFEKRNGQYIYHIDHTFPLARANGNEPINDISYLVLACPTCNMSKGSKYPWEWGKGGRLL